MKRTIAASTLALLALAAVARAQQPDIVLFLLDDADSRLLADNLDVQAFAARGMAFTATVPSPQCAPSRASILTGLHAHNHGVIGNLGGDAAWQANGRGNMLATWLRSAGYYTIKAGKWINDVSPAEDDWSEWLTISQNDDDWLRDFTGEVMAAVLAAPHEKPVFLYFAPGHHWTQPSQQYLGMTQGFQTVPSFNEEDVSDKRDPRLGLLMTPDVIAQVEQTWRLRHDAMHDYADSLAALQGAFVLADRPPPIIFLTSDHGYMQGEHRVSSGKGKHYREATEVPLYVVGPGIAQGRASALVYLLDLPATIAELAGAETPELDGRSLVRFLRGEPVEVWRKRVLLEHASAWSGVVTAGRKLVVFGNDAREIYSRDADPFELQNTCADATCGQALYNSMVTLKACRGATCWQEETR